METFDEVAKGNVAAALYAVGLRLVVCLGLFIGFANVTNIDATNEGVKADVEYKATSAEQKQVAAPRHDTAANASAVDSSKPVPGASEE